MCKKIPALIVTCGRSFTKTELFLFYRGFCKKGSRLYAKTTELFPEPEADIFRFYAPIAGKEGTKRKQYLAQYIIELAKSLDINESEIYIDDAVMRLLCDFLPEILKSTSCAIYDDWDNFLIKYAKLMRVSLRSACIGLICDDPDQARPVIEKICRDVYQIILFTENFSDFEEMNSYFFREYGILLRSGTEKELKNMLLLSVSEDTGAVGRRLSEIKLPVLNISKNLYGLHGVYEDVLFSGNQKIMKYVSKCGRPDGRTLKFLYSVLGKSQNMSNFRDFIKNYDIKYVKLEKND